MRIYPKYLFALAGVLVLAATPATAQLSIAELSVSPFPINTDSVVNISILGDVGCANLDGVEVDGSLVRVQISDCGIGVPPGGNFLIETSVGPLEFGPGTVQVVDSEGTQLASQAIWVVRDFFDEVRFDPVAPRAGVPLSVTLSGNVECPQPREVSIVGNEIEIGFDWGCPFENDPPENFEETFELGILDPGNYTLDMVWPAGNQVTRRIPLTVAAADACVPSDEVLCLTEDRFQVSVEFTTPQGEFGVGQGVELTDDSGYFWFFNEENVEVVVKVLDACFGTGPRFWVFAAGLTNVQTIITVVDTETGTTQLYENPQSTPFQPIQDTNAFNTCP